MKFGEALQRIRFERGMQQQDVAAKARISQTYLSQLETGGKSNPSKRLLQSLCKIYDIPYVVLVWLATEEKDVQPRKRKAYGVLKPAMDHLIAEFIK